MSENKTVGRKIAGRPVRRTQAERRAATRQRLVDATLRSLIEDGYAATTINRIVERAEVSHGASGHYFASKGALIQAAAEELMRLAYRRWGAALLNVTSADDRLQALLNAAWRDVFEDDHSDAFLELFMASRNDPELREHLKPMIAVAMQAFRQSAEHFFEPRHDDVAVYDMMLLSQWLFRGIAMDRRFSEKPEFFRRYVDLWGRVMAAYVEPRGGVTTPPPRPPLLRDDEAGE